MAWTLRGITAIATALVIPAAVLVYLFSPGPPQTIYSVMAFPREQDADAFFIIDFPLALNSDGSRPSMFASIPEVSGQVTYYRMVETPRGPALRMQGQGPVQVSWRSNAPIQGPWPLPLDQRFPGGNPDLSMWRDGDGAPGGGRLGIASLNLQRWDGMYVIGFKAELSFFRGDCDGVTHSADAMEQFELGWYDVEMQSYGLRCT